jgi:hypothetical protein
MSDGGSIQIGTLRVHHTGTSEWLYIDELSSETRLCLGVDEVLALAAVLQRYGEQMVEVEKAYRGRAR